MSYSHEWTVPFYLFIFASFSITLFDGNITCVDDRMACTCCEQNVIIFTQASVPYYECLDSRTMQTTRPCYKPSLFPIVPLASACVYFALWVRDYRNEILYKQTTLLFKVYYLYMSLSLYSNLVSNIHVYFTMKLRLAFHTDCNDHYIYYSQTHSILNGFT